MINPTEKQIVEINSLRNKLELMIKENKSRQSKGLPVLHKGCDLLMVDIRIRELIKTLNELTEPHS